MSCRIGLTISACHDARDSATGREVEMGQQEGRPHSEGPSHTTANLARSWAGPRISAESGHVGGMLGDFWLGWVWPFAYTSFLEGGGVVFGEIVNVGTISTTSGSPSGAFWLRPRSDFDQRPNVSARCRGSSMGLGPCGQLATRLGATCDSGQTFKSATPGSERRFGAVGAARAMGVNSGCNTCGGMQSLCCKVDLSSRKASCAACKLSSSNLPFVGPQPASGA